MSVALPLLDTGALVNCHGWQSFVVKDVSPAWIWTTWGFLVIALSSISSPLVRFQ
jgi:hypothetical protein